MKKTLLLLLVTLMATSAAFSQKKSLDESVYDSWNQISGALLSNDGAYSVYVVNPQEGDGVLYVRDNNNNKITSFERGSAPRLFANGKWVTFKIQKPLALTRKWEVDNVKKDKQEKDSTIILSFDNMYQKELVGINGFKTSPKGNLVAWTEDIVVDKKEGKKEEKRDADKDAKKPFSFGKAYKLNLLDVVSGATFTADSVVNYQLSEDGQYVIFDQVKDGERFVYSATNSKKGFETTQLANLEMGKILSLTLSENGKQIAFSATKDTTEVKKYDLYYGSNSSVSVVVSSHDSQMPKDFTIKGRLSIDKEGKVMFGIDKIAEIHKPVKKSKAETFKFDLWSWHDTLLQTQQMGSSKMQIKNHSYQSMYSPKSKGWVRLTDKYMSRVSMPRIEGSPYALLTDSYKYQWFSTIDSPTGNDIYIINLKDNTKTLLFEKFMGGVSLSPDSKYVLYWDVESQLWNTYDIAAGKHTVIGKDIEYPLYNELSDTPTFPRPYGTMGWSKDSKRVFVKDNYDIYSVDPTGVAPSENVTKIGRQNNETFSVVYQLSDPDQIWVDTKKPIYLSSFDQITRDGGFYKLMVGKTPEKLVESANVYAIKASAEDTDDILFTRESYTEIPDLWIGDINTIASAKKITDINPQSKDYKWGSVELMTWTDFNGDEVEGLLYKPEGYTKDKVYPTIVYFYERSTQGLNKFHMPQPAWSIIIPSMCVSNDYVVFMPDIKYRTGYPGKSSYDAIVSGTMALIERGITDKDHVGLQGQSWGGYASAYLVTQTDLYACAAPGAPVSNMTSAYGGIRWSSGMARSFQYEHGQSRIGATPWERRDLYIDNSPLFFADKVNTPLFIRHDDADEAVPWYQGIEYYIALRRLGKEVWFINYNGDAHNLKNRYARKDFAKRLYQFLDYYLKDADLPRWMEEGISQVEKGKDMKFDLIEK